VLAAGEAFAADLARFENLAARFLSFLFGTTDHGSKTSNRMFQGWLNIR
jgi:hypothetical protein